MSNYFELENQLVLMIQGFIGNELRHQLGNTFSFLYLKFHHILDSIDDLGLPLEASRRLENQIGAVADVANLGQKHLYVYERFYKEHWLPPEEKPTKIVITDLLQDTIELIVPIVRVNRFHIKVIKSTLQWSITTLSRRLKLIILSILLFAIWSQTEKEIVIFSSIPNTLLITSDDRELRKKYFSILGHAADKNSPHMYGEEILLLALRLAQDLGIGIVVLNEDIKATLAIEIPAIGDLDNEGKIGE